MFFFRLKQTSDFWNNISYVLKKTEDGRRKGVGRSRKEGQKKYLGEDELGNPENIRNYLLNDTKNIAKYSNFGEIILCRISDMKIILICDRLWKGSFVRSKGKVPSYTYLGQQKKKKKKFWNI